MKGLIMSFLEAIRPEFWPGDYNFLWIYLLLIIILVVLYESVSQYLSRRSAYDPARAQELRQKMQKAWELQQQHFESSKPPPSVSEPEQIKKETNEEKKEAKQKKNPETSLKNDEKTEKSEENKEEKDEKLERARRKAEYFSGTGGPGGYRPNVKDRYPGVYKRGG